MLGCADSDWHHPLLVNIDSMNENNMSEEKLKSPGIFQLKSIQRFEWNALPSYSMIKRTIPLESPFRLPPRIPEFLTMVLGVVTVYRISTVRILRSLNIATHRHLLQMRSDGYGKFSTVLSLHCSS